jgi:hypothetical protein
VVAEAGFGGGSLGGGFGAVDLVVDLAAEAFWRRFRVEVGKKILYSIIKKKKAKLQLFFYDYKPFHLLTNTRYSLFINLLTENQFNF